MNKFFQPFHLVSLSPWPLLCSLSLMNLFSSLLKVFLLLKYELMLMNYLLFIVILMQWWRDVVRESLYQGNHNKNVIKGLKFGMLLFILSEIMFFISFFWSYFHMFLSLNLEMGLLNDLIMFNPLSIPLMNTLLLLTSGMFITWSHFMILKGNKKMSIFSLFMTIIFGLIFTFMQYMEYNEAFFSINDSVYGSIFFMLTGFHGLHVIVGTLFMIIMLMRLSKSHFTKIHHIGFEFSAWYWHFVDVVWLFLYIFIYWMKM